MKNIIEGLDILSQGSLDLRRAVIQNLWKSPDIYSDELREVLDSEWSSKDLILLIMELVERYPDLIAPARYELDTYKNNLDPDFSEILLEEYRWETMRVLDLWAWPGDVSIRWYQRLYAAWIDVSMSALESSSHFRKKITENSQSAWIPSQTIRVDNDKEFRSWLNPLIWSIANLTWEILNRYDLIVWNYVLDRIDQQRLMKLIMQTDVQNLQFTNCTPLQYSNPETWKIYVPSDQRVISEWAENLEEIWKNLWAQDYDQFFWNNTVTSLQDWGEDFNYAWIRVSK